MSKLSDASDTRQAHRLKYQLIGMLMTSQKPLACTPDGPAAMVRGGSIGQVSIRLGRAMALLADGASALLIDGKMSPGSAGTFPTINPATEEVLGVAADADADDMGRAIDAARRASDDTDWSRNTELRVRCIRQLRDAMRRHLR